MQATKTEWTKQEVKQPLWSHHTGMRGGMGCAWQMVFVVWDTTDPDWLLQTTWASDGESDFVPPDDDSLEPDEELDLDASYGYIDELGDVARRNHYQVISRHSWKESVVADIECQGFEIPEDERP